LKFTSNFFKNYHRDGVNRSAWFQEASYILSNYNQLPGDIIKSDLDRQHLKSLIHLIVQENRNYRASSAALIQSLMTSVLEILLRNIKASLSTSDAQPHQDERIHRLLQYINDHLQQPTLLKVDHLAKEFLLSPTYLSEFFRKKVGVSLREYIIKARLKQVEIRLLNSDHTLTEIAEELSFTDVSHLSKTFKRYTGLSMREFKKRGEYQILKRNYC
ncbi:MAG: AraC family transcriptional regulator, partial [Bacteroidota bacterium]